MLTRIWLLLAIPLLSTGALSAERTSVGRAEVRKAPVVRREALEFYWLKDIGNSKNPKGKWWLHAPSREGGAYVFSGSKGVQIDSVKQPQQVLGKVVRAKQNPPILTSRDLVPNAKAELSVRNQVVVNIQFNERGTKVFAEFTRKHVGQYLAIFGDGKLLTAPRINAAITAGRAEITGFKSLAEAQRLAERINTASSDGTPAPASDSGSKG